MASPTYLTTPLALDPIQTTTGLNRALALVFTWRQGSLQANVTGDLYDIRYRIGAGAFTTVSNQTPVPTGGGLGAARDYQHTWATNTFAAGTTYGWQVRMREPGSGIFTAWSTEQFFRAEAAPTNPVITSPTAAQVVTVTPHSVTWTLTTQANYRVRLLNAGVAEYDSGIVSSVALRTHSVPLITTGARTMEVSTQSASGMPWGLATVAFTSATIPPATPTSAAGTTSDAASIGVRHHASFTSVHPAPSGGQPAVASVDYYLRRVGDSSGGALVATSTSSGGGIWSAAYTRLQQGTWEVAAVAISNLGLRSAKSGFTALTLQPNIVGVVVSHPTDFLTAAFFRFNDEGAQEKVAVVSELRQYVGRTSPSIEFDATTVNRDVTVSKVTCKTADVAQLTALKSLLLMRTVLVYRDKRGRKVIGLMELGSIDDVAHGWELSLVFTETDYPTDVLV